MQDAYFQEKGDVGNWLAIGYSAPDNGNSFSYASGVFEYSTSATALSDTDKNDWMTDPKVDLNDCKKANAKAGSWKLTALLSEHTFGT